LEGGKAIHKNLSTNYTNFKNQFSLMDFSKFTKHFSLWAHYNPKDGEGMNYLLIFSEIRVKVIKWINIVI
jgi:hypothetical protein